MCSICTFVLTYVPIGKNDKVRLNFGFNSTPIFTDLFDAPSLINSPVKSITLGPGFKANISQIYVENQYKAQDLIDAQVFTSDPKYNLILDPPFNQNFSL